MHDLVQTLEHVGQSHLLRFIDDLNPPKKEDFIARLMKVDWQLVNRLVSEVASAEPHEDLAVEPADFLPMEPADQGMRSRYEEAVACGEQALREGKVAAFTVAGGDGTRLGWNHPKGTFPITPVKGHSLFQVFAEKIRYAGTRYGIVPRWFVMTSEKNHEDTVEFFEEHDYFGLSTDRVTFFMQGQLPACDASGKLLLAEKDRLAMSPDGHGGCLKGLGDSGAVDAMLADNVHTLSYFQVDNPLVSVVDPLFIGLHILERSQVSSRAICKRSWSEKMGVFCRSGGRLKVVEYVDLPESEAKRLDDDGNLAFRAGSPAIHLFDVEFIRDLNAGGFSLPYHQAQKRIPYLDTNGTQVAPEEPNGIKFETFVFDAIPLAERTLVLEAERRSEFAPVKNRSGEDSPESCRKMMTEQFASWLESRGCKVPRAANSTVDCVIEISPLVACRSEDLADLDLPETINPKEEVCLP